MAYSIETLHGDLRIAGMSQGTAETYCGQVQRFERWTGRPATEVGETEVREFLLHLRQDRKVVSRTYIVYLAALTFLYQHTLGRPEVVAGFVRPKVVETLILVPTVSEVRALIECAPSPFVRAMFEAAYGCGLRASEVCALQAADIDSTHQLVHVRHGKGDKARVVMLGERLLQSLRDHWRFHRLPGPWLFPMRGRGRGRGRGMWSDAPVGTSWLGRRFRLARARAEIHRRITLHGFRHAFASHLLEHGTDTAILRVLMGHKNIATTAHYAQVPTHLLSRTPSPLDLLYRS